MHPSKTAFALAFALTGVGCASATLPNEQLASAEASVRAARELGANSVPRAELHLKLANDQVSQARKLAKDGETEEASRVLGRARADAELALALTREASAHKDLEKTASPASTSQNIPSHVHGNSPAASAAR